MSRAADGAAMTGEETDLSAVRLVLVSNTFPSSDISGVGSLVDELAREALHRGLAVRVITRHGPLERREVVSTGGPKLLFPLLAVRALLALPAHDGPQVVHVHESDGTPCLLALRWLRRGRRWAGCRLVATLQVSYRRERLAVRAVRSDGLTVSRPTPGEWMFAFFRAPLLALLGRATARLADAVVAPSRVTAKELQEDYGAADVQVIANGTSIDPAPRAEVDGSAAEILFVGRLRTRKALAVLLQAMKALRPECPEAVLSVVGDGEQRRALEAARADLEITETVHFLGTRSRDQVRQLMHRARVLCLPSTYEGLPVAILEAMAAGLPVVATGVSGIPEAVEDGETGFVVPAESAAELAGALLRLLRDPALARRLGEAGRVAHERRFSIAVVVERHLALYARLLG